MFYALFIALALCITNQLSGITLIELVSEQNFPIVYTDMYGYNVLDLSNRNIHDIGNIHLLPVFFKSQIVSLYRIPNCKLILSNNTLTTLDESLACITGLKVLFASDNRLSTLPANIYLAKDLEILYVSRNRISILPESIGLLDQLKVVDLSSNCLTLVPEAITFLPNLTHLFVNYNSLIHAPICSPGVTVDARNNPCTTQRPTCSLAEDLLNSVLAQELFFDDYVLTPAQQDLQSDF